MSDSLPSSCPRRPYSLLFVFSFLFITHIPVFGNNDPRPPIAASGQMMQLREFIAGYAQNFVGIEYKHGGGSTAKGFDCSGFTSFALAEFGVKVSASSSTQARQGEEVSLDAVLPGDLIFFGRRGRVTHVAMVVRRTGEGIFCVHSTCSRGIVVENISTSRYWKPKIMFARDVITRQAIDNCLLQEPAGLEEAVVMPSLPAPEETMYDCPEEFEQACRSIAPLALLSSPDLQEQFNNVIAHQRFR